MKILSFEALRGLLALWVVIGHVIKHAGYNPEELGPFKLLASPGLAVDCFIILSGFVIFMLLDSQRTSYAQFITRRFFRLAPLYFVLCVISVMTLDWQTSVISGQTWQSSAVINDQAIHRDTKQYLFQHLIAHATMLHGAIADKILPHSEYAIVGQAWSISVEWQFYLIAPALFFLISTRKWRGLGCVLLMICLARALNYGAEGFLINQAGYFLIGIACYFAWKQSDLTHATDFRLVEIFALMGIMAAYFMTTRSVSLIIWTAAFTMALAEKHKLPTRLLAMFTNVAKLPLLQWLGKISYSVYMVHMLIAYFWFACLPHLFPGIGKRDFLLCALPLITFSTLIVSTLTHRFIELPGMRLGARVSKGRAVQARNPEPAKGEV